MRSIDGSFGGSRWSAAIVACAVGVSALPAVAAEEVVHRAEEIRVEDQRIRPAEIFEPTPVEVEVLTADEIERLPATNAAEAIAMLPGIRAQQRVQGEQAAVSIEGMPATYTLILVNGQRYSGELGGTSDLRDFPLANVERIEIVRGAGGLRYGPEAGGGVINFVTRRAPREGARAEADGGYGSAGKIFATGTVAAGSSQAGGTLSYTHDQIDGFDAPSDTGKAVFIPSGSDSTRASDDLYGTFELDPHERITLRTLGGFRTDDEDFGPSSAAGASGARTSQRWLLAQEATVQLSDALELFASATWYDARTRSNIGREFTLAEQELEIDAELNGFFEAGPTSHLFSFGLDATTPRMQLQDQGPPTSTANPVAQPVYREAGFETLGIYLITESQLTGWLDLEAGLRAQFHSEFEPSYLPQAALLARPWRGERGGSLALRVSYGRNHRTPSLRDLYQPDTPQLGLTYFLSGNPDLQPETSDSYRAGVEYSPIPPISFALTGFWNDIEDHIRSTDAGRRIAVGQSVIVGNAGGGGRPGLGLICQATGNFFPECGAAAIVTSIMRPVFQKTNLDTVRTAGVEARVHWRPAFGLDLRLAYTFLDTEVVDSNVPLDELPNEAPHVVDVEAFYRTPWTDTGLTGRLRWRSAAPIETSGTGLLGFASTDRSDPSLQLDLRVEQPLTEWLSIYADVYNVTDERVIDSYVVRGRSYFGALRVRWH